MAHHIFLSYRRTDQPLARALVEAMEAEGLDVWWDQEIEGGEDWREAIVEGLTASQSLVILFSEDCNSSKQLKKELAIADTLDKEIIPVLIEETKPKGHYLYELAARNWLQITPDPESKVGDLAKRLASEMDVKPPVAARAAMDMEEVVASEPPAESFSLAPGYEEPPLPGEPLEQAGTEPTPATPAAPMARAQAPVEAPLSAETVKKVVRAAKTERAVKQDRRDFLPFKWFEVLIAALIGGFIGFVTYEQRGEIDIAGWDFGLGFAMTLVVIAIIVFPFRYYFRRRRVWRAVKFYLLSNLTMAVLMGVFIGVHPDIVDQSVGGMENLLYGVVGSIVLVALISVVAFSIYGLLHFQRTMRHFNRNVEAI
ncbi:MAG: TIR domain-containing protein [Hyphomonadaceae bacterium]|nr:TIR domain-containing protein [Hyphomonadaceae bacterium]